MVIIAGFGEMSTLFFDVFFDYSAVFDRFLRSYSSLDPGYLHDQTTIPAMKAADQRTAVRLWVVNQRKVSELDMTISIAYLSLVGKTRYSTQFVRNGPKYL
jgi:hypothetical protein